MGRTCQQQVQLRPAKMLLASCTAATACGWSCKAASTTRTTNLCSCQTLSRSDPGMYARSGQPATVPSSPVRAADARGGAGLGKRTAERPADSLPGCHAAASLALALPFELPFLLPLLPLLALPMPVPVPVLPAPAAANSLPCRSTPCCSCCCWC
ncbi:hypothetical protein COO60DRAFT_1505097 [Scenedesmus sp. NREL 46B-D3]|nr:hypothetical protein COO60DRAFT_1505097 [Scenedesmus sp. NREL 46B-D3]